MKIPVGISARHLHLTKEDYIKIFGYDELTKFKDIKQPHLFAAEEKVTIKGLKGQKENVRILGPFRSYSQVEISKTDSYELGVEVVERRSGDLANTNTIRVIGPVGEIDVPVIMANRHVHISKDQAKKLNIEDNQRVLIKIDSQKPGTIMAYFKVDNEAFFELHLDLDDANAFLLKQDDIVELIL